MQILTCLQKCKESVFLYFKTPSSFVETREEDDQSLSLLSSGNSHDLQGVIDDLVYLNTNNIPVRRERTLKFSIEDLETFEKYKQEVIVQAARHDSKLLVEGTCPFTFHKKSSISRLCNDIQVSSQNCNQVVDTLRVSSVEPLDNSERVFIPSTYLNRYKLNVQTSKYGFVVYGIATIKEYSHIMRQIKYSNGGRMENGDRRVFKVHLNFVHVLKI